MKKEASIGPKKIFEDHISLCVNSGSFSKETLTEVEEVPSFRRTEKRKNLVYVATPTKQRDSECDKKLIPPIGEPSESNFFESNFTVAHENNGYVTEAKGEECVDKNKNRANFGKIPK